MKKYKYKCMVLEVEQVIERKGKIIKENLRTVVYKRWYGWRFLGPTTFHGLQLPYLFYRVEDALATMDENFLLN